MSVTSARPAVPKIDLDQVRAAIELLIEPDAVFEFRAPIGKKRTAGGYFANDSEGVDAFLPVVKAWSSQQRPQDQPSSLYITLNRLDPRLIARAPNQVEPYADKLTGDTDVTRLRWIPIDGDVERPSGVSSTNEEHEAALILMDEVAQFLRERGIHGIEADSGNGGHILVPIDLPNTPESRALTERVLKALAHRFDTAQVKIDPTTFNPSRVFKLYGSLAGKGHSTAQQPHRLAKILHVPGDLTPVSVEQLQSIAALLPEPPKPAARSSASSSAPLFDARAFMKEHYPEVEPEDYQGGLIWKLPECQFNTGHTDGKAAVIQASRGGMTYKCLAASCKGNNWQAFRDAVDPGGSQRRQANGYERAPHPADAESAVRVEVEEKDLSDLSRLSRTPAVFKNWPAPVAREALHGVVGDLVRRLEPQTEADEAALLFNTLSGVSNLIGNGPHGYVGATRHALKMNTCIVGETGQARKGTGWDPIEATLRRVDELWADERIMTNLSSGEGLIWAVRDPITKTVIEKDKKTGRPTGETFTDIDDAGVEDKRLYVVVSEFAGPLKVGSRDGNILFDVIRQAWDGDRLQIPTKHNAAKARGVHVSVNGHITPADLKRYMSETDLLNGVANRFLWILSKRSKELPEGGEMPGLNDIVQRLKSAIDGARGVKDTVGRDLRARHVWKAVYHSLTTPPPGLFGAVTSRAAPYVLRISILFAVLDGERVVRVPHLLAALACWDYVDASARIIFGDRTGNPYADQILAELRKSKIGGLYRNDIGELFSGHKKDTEQIALALGQLEDWGLAESTRRQTAPKGRPAEFWTAINKSNAGVTGRFLAMGKAAAAEIETLSEGEISEISARSHAEAAAESLVAVAAGDEAPELDF